MNGGKEKLSPEKSKIEPEENKNVPDLGDSESESESDSNESENEDEVKLRSGKKGNEIEEAERKRKEEEAKLHEDKVEEYRKQAEEQAKRREDEKGGKKTETDSNRIPLFTVGKKKTNILEMYNIQQNKRERERKEREDKERKEGKQTYAGWFGQERKKKANEKTEKTEKTNTEYRGLKFDQKKWVANRKDEHSGRTVVWDKYELEIEKKTRKPLHNGSERRRRLHGHKKSGGGSRIIKHRFRKYHYLIKLNVYLIWWSTLHFH